MRIIGITGGIGSGKSTAARILEDIGAKVIFADKVAKEVVNPGMPAYADIIAYFGTSILDDSGEINRKKLGEIVFSDQQKLEKLNEITHGHVIRKINEMLQTFREQGVSVAVVEAIVPTADGFLDLVDSVWVILASEETRVKRVMLRNGLTEGEARQRVMAQMSDASYKSLATQIIWNDGTVEELQKKIWEVYNHDKSAFA